MNTSRPLKDGSCEGPAGAPVSAAHGCRRFDRVGVRAWAGVVLLGGAVATMAAGLDLPEGWEARRVAGPPLVQHPIMASLGAPGQLFVGDAAGKNLRKDGLEKELPNRVVLLTDTDRDGTYDRASVFADRMTFPQGGVWLGGSFYVASPPGIWRLTDTDGDGQADRREMLVDGFEYTGNAADVHGPFLHPNGRLYWCHGRKGHVVKQRDGTLVHSGMASGIWSMRPDGSDIRWFALGCADNPTEIDFTPEGEVVGTVNLYYGVPRGDTLLHWLRGGVYEREDQLEVIADLPRTLDPMPVAHNYGHVAVSGCAYYRSGVLEPAWRGNLFVVHFNTRRVTRMEAVADGSSYRFREHEFAHAQDPDAHLTDVLEDRDGTLLVVDTGGWFRVGCPSSVVAKPEAAGAVYRVVRRDGRRHEVEPWGMEAQRVWEMARGEGPDRVPALVAHLASGTASVAHAAANALAALARPESIPALVRALKHADPGTRLAAAHALGEMPSLGEEPVAALLGLLEPEVLDRGLEHQVLFALRRAADPQAVLRQWRLSGAPSFRRRLFGYLEEKAGASLEAGEVLPLLESPDAPLGEAAARWLSRRRAWMPQVTALAGKRLADHALTPALLGRLETAVSPWTAEPSVRQWVARLVEGADADHRAAGWRLMALAETGTAEPAWVAAAERYLARTDSAELGPVLEASARLREPRIDAALRRVTADPGTPPGLRLRATAVLLRPGSVVPEDAFRGLLESLSRGASPSARLQAGRCLAAAKLSKAQFLAVAEVLAALGPVELRLMVPLLESTQDAEVGMAFARALARAPGLGTFQESEIRTWLSAFPPECFALVAPALQELAEAEVARRRKLDTLPAAVVARGRAAEGRRLFEEGRGSCSACHRIGEVGTAVGPNLSAIGRIRTESDLLESILFPNATLARDYEAHAFELSDGESLVGVILRNLPGTLVVADASGQERTLARARVVSQHSLPTSLMPTGLEASVTEDELLDLVAYLRSRQ